MSQFTKKSRNAVNNITVDGFKSERLIGELLELLPQEGDYSATGCQMLQIIGEHLAADHCRIFKCVLNDFKELENLFEWSDPSLNDHLLCAETNHFENCNEQLLHERPFQLRSQDGRSHTLCGIRIDEKPYGVIDIEWNRKEENVSNDKISVIPHIANFFRLLFQRNIQQEILLESISYQRQIIDNIAIPILLVDLDCRVLTANPHKKIAVDMPLSQLIGTHCYDTVCKFGSPPEFCAVQRTLQTQQPYTSEYSFQGKRLITTAQPIFDRNGKMQTIMSIDIDITDLTRQKEELRVAMEQAQAANHAKSFFLATVSHELRTPLNAVIGFSELLQSGNIDNATQQEYLESINYAGIALLNLINDVLDLSNLEADRTLIAPVNRYFRLDASGGSNV